MFPLRGSLQAQRKGLERRAWRSEILNLSWARQARERATRQGRLRDRHGGELSDERGEAREATGASEFGDPPSSPTPPHQERENEEESVSAFPAPPGKRTGRERGSTAPQEGIHRHDLRAQAQALRQGLPLHVVVFWVPCSLALPAFQHPGGGGGGQKS